MNLVESDEISGEAAGISDETSPETSTGHPNNGGGSGGATEGSPRKKQKKKGRCRTSLRLASREQRSAADAEQGCSAEGTGCLRSYMQRHGASRPTTTAHAHIGVVANDDALFVVEN